MSIGEVLPRIHVRRVLELRPHRDLVAGLPRETLCDEPEAVRRADVEPGSANTKVPLASPANARDCSDDVPISSKDSARNSSPKPGMVLSSSGSSASGVASRPVKPVPPVTSTPSIAASAIQRETTARTR